MIPVDGHKNLFRDENTGAILNCDSSSYEKYIKMRDEKKRQKEDIENLKGEIKEIKSLLMELINASK